MVAKLSVNVNAVAYLRNRRGLPWPSPLEVARRALEAGASGITVHPRPDRRHIRREDVVALERLLRHDFPDAELNIEGYPDEPFLALVHAVRPDQVTLVPDAPGQSTSDHGWTLAADGERLRHIVRPLRDKGFRVSLFIDPDVAAPSAAKETGADRVEIFTGPYGGALESSVAAKELERIARVGLAADGAGIGINAGHDLTRANLPALVRALPGLLEVSIGHALVGDAMLFGIAEAVRLYRSALGDDAAIRPQTI